MLWKIRTKYSKATINQIFFFFFALHFQETEAIVFKTSRFQGYIQKINSRVCPRVCIFLYLFVSENLFSSQKDPEILEDGQSSRKRSIMSRLRCLLSWKNDKLFRYRNTIHPCIVLCVFQWAFSNTSSVAFQNIAMSRAKKGGLFPILQMRGDNSGSHKAD